MRTSFSSKELTALLARPAFRALEGVAKQLGVRLPAAPEQASPQQGLSGSRADLASGGVAPEESTRREDVRGADRLASATLEAATDGSLGADTSAPMGGASHLSLGADKSASLGGTSHLSLDADASVPMGGTGNLSLDADTSAPRSGAGDATRSPPQDTSGLRLRVRTSTPDTQSLRAARRIVRLLPTTADGDGASTPHAGPARTLAQAVPAVPQVTGSTQASPERVPEWRDDGRPVTPEHGGLHEDFSAAAMKPGPEGTGASEQDSPRGAPPTSVAMKPHGSSSTASPRRVVRLLPPLPPPDAAPVTGRSEPLPSHVPSAGSASADTPERALFGRDTEGGRSTRVQPPAHFGGSAPGGSYPPPAHFGGSAQGDTSPLPRRSARFEGSSPSDTFAPPPHPALFEGSTQGQPRRTTGLGVATPGTSGATSGQREHIVSSDGRDGATRSQRPASSSGTATGTPSTQSTRPASPEAPRSPVPSTGGSAPARARLTFASEPAASPPPAPPQAAARGRDATAEQLGAKVTQGLAPVWEQAHQVTHSALTTGQAPTPTTRAGTDPAVRNTFNVSVHLDPANAQGGLDRRALEDALVDILRETARRHGLEV